MCEASAVFVCSDTGSICFFYIFVVFLVRWSTDDDGDVLCHYEQALQGFNAKLMLGFEVLLAGC